MRRVLATLTLLASAAAAPRAQPPVFTFESGFWLNLHHFLYVLGRAEAGMPDATRRAVAEAPKDARALAGQPAESQQLWTRAVAFYQAGLSKSDAVFDKALVQVTRTLADAGDAATLDGLGLDPDLGLTLAGAAPVYRRVWWPQHQSANRARIATYHAWLGRHGPAIRDRLTRLYEQQWPANGQPVEVAAYGNWAGAYSTVGGLIVVSSLDRGTDGALGLETLFHEAMHQWDDQVFAMIIEEAKRQKKFVSATVTHAMIFYTAGDAVTRVVPGHVPYAAVEGMWERPPFGPYAAPLQRAWQPFLDGTTSRAEAVKALVEQLPTLK